MANTYRWSIAFNSTKLNNNDFACIFPVFTQVMVLIMGGKTKSAKRCVMVNGVIFSGLQGVLRAIFGTLKT